MFVNENANSDMLEYKNANACKQKTREEAQSNYIANNKIINTYAMMAAKRTMMTSVRKTPNDTSKHLFKMHKMLRLNAH